MHHSMLIVDIIIPCILTSTPCSPVQLEKADIAVERETYEASRHGLNELYLLAKEELVSTSSRITEQDRDLEVCKP